MKNKILTKKKIIAYIEDGCKSKERWKIGTEHEKFAFQIENFKPINYEKISLLFSALNESFGWKKIYEGSNIVALEKAGCSITLEPGGQIELSGAPLENLFQTCEEVNLHQSELNSVSEKLGINYMGMGFLPKWELSDIKIMPKKRYQIMSKYMQKVGTNGLDMMLRTSTIQANFDFESEEDMVKKFRVGLSIQPAIIALYANSPFVSGKLSSYLSYRSWVWTKTDNQRCGILPFVFDDGFSFESYVDYLLKVPMYFVRRDGEYIDCAGSFFSDFMEGKLGVLPGRFPTMTDWMDHLTVAFPEVRLKKFIELRGADGGPWSSVCALPAFWTGIFYNSEILNEVWELVKNWNNEQRKIFYDEVSRKGLQSKTPDKSDIKVFLLKLLKLSSKGLERRNIKKKSNNETIFLKPLFKILENGLSPAENWKNLYLNEWKGNIDYIYKSNFFSFIEQKPK